MKKKSHFQHFEEATDATLKLFSEDIEISALFNEDLDEPNNLNAVVFPTLEPKHPGYYYIRHLADMAALKKRWDDPKIHAYFQPQSTAARDVYEAMMATRLIGKAAQKWRGIYNNHMSYALSEAQKINLTNNPNITLNGRHLGVRLALLQHLKLPISQPLKAQAKAWHAKIKDDLPPYDQLHTLLESQSDWAQALKNIIPLLCPEENDLKTDDQDSSKQSIENRGSEAPLNQENDMAVEGKPSEKSDNEGKKDTHSDAQEQNSQKNAPEDFETAPSAHSGDLPFDAATPPYRIFTTQYDQIVHARSLASLKELKTLRLKLDEQTQKVQNIINRLANKLQRHLMAQQKRFWQFDLEDGILDTARLTRVIANPSHSLAYKNEIETPLRHTIVSILIDNSGSMRGRPIALAAIITEILARTLERCGIVVEILGFTTQHWRGGQSRKAWEMSKSPKNPGRLNDLQHIIYKSAHQPYRRARLPIALMLKDGLLKENIDGEALIWAATRLMQHPQERKILITLSDGAPVDDATLAENEPNILYQHLRQTILHIENQKNIELLAFGIGHDVTDIYSHAMTVSTMSELADILFDKMIALFQIKN